MIMHSPKCFLYHIKLLKNYISVLDRYHSLKPETKSELPFFHFSTESSSCPPGWHTLGESCFQLNITPLKSWADAQRECYVRGGKLAMFDNSLSTQDLTNFLDDYMEYLGRFYSGAHAVKLWHFSTIENKRFNSTSSLWGPGEPTGDGLCGNMLLGRKGWRVNDESCYVNIGFVCQKKKNTSGKDTSM